MLSVEEARSSIVDGTQALSSERVELVDLPGRIAAADCVAAITQPPFSASAMDGYAVRQVDVTNGAELSVVGEVPAGQPFDGIVGQGEAARIFTGGVVPNGADRVIIQENVQIVSPGVIVIDPTPPGPSHIRAAGVDFAKGDVLVQSGTRFHEVHGSILAAANLPEAQCVRRPTVAIFSNGDELKEPGQQLASGEIVNSNRFALTAMLRSWGAEPVYLGCARDDRSHIEQFFRNASSADVILPVGGASVGDFDYVKDAFAAVGGELAFSKVAVKPGKPTWFGRMGDTRIIGLPGNPASAIVTCALFVKPLVYRLLGCDDALQFRQAQLKGTLPKNGPRETYLRARSEVSASGVAGAIPYPNQDSSLLRPFGECDLLIRREMNAEPLETGDMIEVISLLHNE